MFAILIGAGILAFVRGCASIMAILGSVLALGIATRLETGVHAAAWMPALQVSAGFKVDGLSHFFVYLILGVGLLIKVFSAAYFKARRAEFFAKLAFFEVSMLGLVLADDLLLLFTFWELTSMSSFLLIAWDKSEEAVLAARRAWIITGAGGLAMLGGVLLVRQGGITTICALTSLDGLAMWLILAGALTKSGQIPFHFWLPGAMRAPAPVSAFLHSATMVKAGIYLMARLSMTVGVQPVLVWIGLATLVWGAVRAAASLDLKEALAFTTISALGAMTALAGAQAFPALAAFLLFHALYKASLFLGIAAVEKRFGTRNVHQLGAWMRGGGPAAWSVGLASLAMLGLPIFGSFTAKELSLKELGSPAWMGTFAFGLAIMAFTPARILYSGLWGSESPEAKPVPAGIWAPPLVLAIAGTASLTLFSPALSLSSAAMGYTHTPPFSMWYGFNFVLAVSLATVAVGFGLAAWDHSRRRFILPQSFAERGFESGILVLDSVSRAVISRYQNGSIRNYQAYALVALVTGIAWGLALHPPTKEINFEAGPKLQIHEVLLVLLGMASAVGAIYTQSRRMAIMMLGLVGLTISALFLQFGAPDLALTQFVVETLGVLLLSFALARLPQFRKLSSNAQRRRDHVIAIACGVAVFAAINASMPAERESLITPYVVENSEKGAKAQNVVNAILVDFRGVDTLGEGFVLITAAIGATALLARRKHPKENQ